jgi:calcineurin-like phosphoesterase family protein
MTTWLTADLHLSHELVSKIRGFDTVTKHDRTLIRNYNELVKDGDEVYIVGDFCMWGTQNIGNVEALVKKLKGNKHLILGNHDKLKPFDYIEAGIVSVHTSIILPDIIESHLFDPARMFGGPLNVVHDPSVVTMNPRARWICGHVHDLFRQIGTCLNVGVDVWGQVPVQEEVVRKFLLNAEPTEDQLKMKQLVVDRHEPEEES